MKIDINTKFNIDDTGYVWVYGWYVPVRILNINVSVNKQGVEISYEVDDSLVREVKEKDLLTDKEVNSNKKIKSV